MRYFLQLLVASVLFLNSHAVFSVEPSQAQIIQWINNIQASAANPSRNIKVENTQKVYLKSGEEAYLSSVYFNESARNFWGGYILTRPKLKQSKILDFGGQTNTFQIFEYYAQGRTFNIFEVQNASSGQGAMEGEKVVIVIDGWNVKTLSRLEEQDVSAAVDEESCKTHNNQQGYFNMMPYQNILIMTTIRSNACENLKLSDYKVNTKLVEINL